MCMSCNGRLSKLALGLPGVIFTPVPLRELEGTALLMLDTRDLAARPVAEVALPRRVHAGLHGSGLPA